MDECLWCGSAAVFLEPPAGTPSRLSLAILDRYCIGSKPIRFELIVPLLSD